MINVMGLLKKEFKPRDHVIVIHDDTSSGAGELIFGKLTIKNDTCLIGNRELDWNNVLFMAHDGFPCRTLKLNLSNEQLYDIDNTELILLMRKLLVKDEETAPEPVKKEIIPPSREFVESIPYRSYGGCAGGCPFVFEDIYMEIINPFQPVGSHCEETLIMQASDGAKGFMWDIEEEIFDFCIEDSVMIGAAII